MSNGLKEIVQFDSGHQYLFWKYVHLGQRLDIIPHDIVIAINEFAQ